jgi:hypothetical protein
MERPLPNPPPLDSFLGVSLVNLAWHFVGSRRILPSAWITLAHGMTRSQTRFRDQKSHPAFYCEKNAPRFFELWMMTIVTRKQIFNLISVVINSVGRTFSDRLFFLVYFTRTE